MKNPDIAARRSDVCRQGVVSFPLRSADVIPRSGRRVHGDSKFESFIAHLCKRLRRRPTCRQKHPRKCVPEALQLISINRHPIDRWRNDPCLDELNDVQTRTQFVIKRPRGVEGGHVRSTRKVLSSALLTYFVVTAPLLRVGATVHVGLKEERDSSHDCWEGANDDGLPERYAARRGGRG